MGICNNYSLYWTQCVFSFSNRTFRSCIDGFGTICLLYRRFQSLNYYAAMRSLGSFILTSPSNKTLLEGIMLEWTRKIGLLWTFLLFSSKNLKLKESVCFRTPWGWFDRKNHIRTRWRLSEGNFQGSLFSNLLQLENSKLFVHQASRTFDLPLIFALIRSSSWVHLLSYKIQKVSGTT